jgi:hypothetical protein
MTWHIILPAATMFHPIPAKGYQLISGTRAPPASWGAELYTQLRNGWCSDTPWPVKTCDWLHSGSMADIVSVKKVEPDAK